MEIAKGVTTADYLKLDLSDFKNKDWLKAIDFFEKRINDRFIEKIQNKNGLYIWKEKC